MTKLVQVVFSFDTTGSMSSAIDAVKKNVADLSADLFKRAKAVGADLQIGLLAHGDYCDAASAYLVKSCPMTRDAKKIQDWVKTVGMTAGGDAPEAYEQALRFASKGMAWAADAEKVIVLIGDCDPQPANYPLNVGATDWKKELAGIAEKGIRVFPLQVHAGQTPSPFYRALAEETDGVWLSLQDLGSMGSAFEMIVLREVDRSAFEAMYDTVRAGKRAEMTGRSAQLLLTQLIARQGRMSDDELADIAGLVKGSGSSPAAPKAPCAKVGVKITLDPSMAAATVELSQVFSLPTSTAAAEYTYRLPVPGGAAVYDFVAELELARKKIRTKLEEIKKAKEEFAQAVRAGKKAVLAEQELPESDIFKISVGNLEPGETVRCTTTFVLEMDAAQAELALPTYIAPRQHSQLTAEQPADVAVELEVTNAPGAIAVMEPRASWDGTKPLQFTGSCRIVSLRGGNLRLRFADTAAAPVSAASYPGWVDSERLVRIELPEEPSSMRPEVIVLDGSRSMAAQWPAALKAAQHAAVLFPDAKLFVCRNAAQRVDSFELSLKPWGGSRLAAALELAKNQHALLITDGLVAADEQKKLEELAKTNTTRVSVIGVGQALAEGFLQRLALRSAGSYSRGLGLAARAIGARAPAARVSGALAVYPSFVPGLCYARVNAGAALQLDGAPLDYAPCDTDIAARRLACKAAVTMLTMDDAPAADICAAALSGGIASTQTAFVGVEEEEPEAAAARVAREEAKAKQAAEQAEQGREQAQAQAVPKGRDEEVDVDDGDARSFSGALEDDCMEECLDAGSVPKCTGFGAALGGAFDGKKDGKKVKKAKVRTKGDSAEGHTGLHAMMLPTMAAAAPCGAPPPPAAPSRSARKCAEARPTARARRAPAAECAEIARDMDCLADSCLARGESIDELCSRSASLELHAAKFCSKKSATAGILGGLAETVSAGLRRLSRSSTRGSTPLSKSSNSSNSPTQAQPKSEAAIPLLKVNKVKGIALINWGARDLKVTGGSVAATREDLDAAKATLDGVEWPAGWEDASQFRKKCVVKIVTAQETWYLYLEFDEKTERTRGYISKTAPHAGKELGETLPLFGAFANRFTALRVVSVSDEVGTELPMDISLTKA